MSRATDEQISAWSDMRLNVIPRAGAFGDVLDALIAERKECESRFTVDTLDAAAVTYMGNDPEWLAWGCRPREPGRGHDGHISHCHASHGNSWRCSCGEFMGCFSIVLTGEEAEPPPCPLCPPDNEAGSTP